MGKIKKPSPKPGKKVIKKPSPKDIVLKNVSAAQIILSNYASAFGNKKLMKIEEDSEDGIPQTLISQGELEYDSDIPVTKLLFEKSKRAYYFLDARKVQNKFWGIMIDVTSNGPLSNTIQKPCWWCRHKFNTVPIGCPIKYNSQKTSGIEKERIEEKFKEAGFPTSTNDFFETEGCFCSFPCCKSFILDQRGSVKYKESLTLLSLLFSTLFSTEKKPVGIFSVENKKLRIKNCPERSLEETDFPAAPSWRLLKEYGGHLTIEEFRATFGKLEYELTVNTRRPYMYSSSQYVSEKKIKLFKGIRD